MSRRSILRNRRRRRADEGLSGAARLTASSMGWVTRAPLVSCVPPGNLCEAVGVFAAVRHHRDALCYQAGRPISGAARA